MILSICSAVEADVEYTAQQFVYGTTVRLSGEFVDPSSSSMNMDQTLTWAGLQTLCVQLNLLTVNHRQLLFSFSRPCNIVHTFLHVVTQYDDLSKWQTKGFSESFIANLSTIQPMWTEIAMVSIMAVLRSCIKKETTIILIFFLYICLTITISSVIINNDDETSPVSKHWPKTTLSERRDSSRNT